MDMASVAGNYISETFFCSSVLSALTEIDSSRRRWTIYINRRQIGDILPV